MGLWTSFLSAVTGTDLEAEQARGDSLDAQLTTINNRDYQPGGQVYNEIADTQGTAAADRAQQVVAQDLSTGGTGNVTASVGSEFNAGLNQGLNNVLDFPGKVVGAAGSGANQILLGILKNIPWWVYVGAAVGAFFYFGGFALVLRRFIKR